MPTQPNARSTHKRGTVAIVVTLTMMSMLGLMALSIDVAYMYSVEAELQGGIDAAVLAGAANIDQGPAAVRARTKAFAAANNVGGTPLVINDTDIVFGDWDVSTSTFTPAAREEDGFAIQITASNTVGLFFGNALGMASSTRSRSATAAYSGGAGSSWDIVVVQDVTGSFDAALPQAKLADTELLQCVRKSTVGSLFGVVAFAETADNLVTPSPIDATADADAVATKIDSMSAGGRTNIGAGLAAGTAMLTSSSSDLPPAIVLVSDGLPNRGLYGPTKVCVKYKHGSCDKWDYPELVAPELYGTEQADNAWDNYGISIYTLYYSGSSSSDAAAGSAYLSSLIRGDGTAHTNVDPADMETTLKAICRSRFKLRIVE